MTTAQLVTYFSVLQDKYGSPNLITSEIESFLNHATNEWLNRLVPDSEGGVVNFEEDSNVTAQIRPLIYTISLSSTSGGLLTDSAINTALTTAVGSSSTYFRPMSMLYNSTPIKYVKHNDIGAYLVNSYKTPSTTNRMYTQTAGGFQLYPQTTTSVLFTVMKKPKVLVSGSVDPEFDDQTSYQILSLALSIAGISTRDGELAQLVQSSTLQGLK